MGRMVAEYFWTLFPRQGKLKLYNLGCIMQHNIRIPKMTLGQIELAKFLVNETYYWNGDEWHKQSLKEKIFEDVTQEL